MSTSKLLKWSVAVALLLFVFIFGSIVLFGLFNDINGKAINVFKTIYFAFALVVLGVVYLENTDLLVLKIEHVLILFSIILFSAGIATMMGSIKSFQANVPEYASGASSTGSISSLKAQNNLYVQQTNSMVALEKEIASNNRILEKDVGLLAEKISNIKPVIVETIVTIPGEVIYEEEPAPLVVKIREDDDEEEEDD